MTDRSRNRPAIASPRTRRGTTLVEVAVALLVLGVAMTTAAQVLGWVVADRREANRRQWALREAQNVMERLNTMPAETLDEARISSLNLGERSAQTLPEGRVDVRLTEEAESHAKRLTVEVRWRNLAGEDVAPVRLTAWTYPNSPPAEPEPEPESKPEDQP